MANRKSPKKPEPPLKIQSAKVRKGKIKPSDLKDLRYVGHLASLLEPLHRIGTR